MKPSCPDCGALRDRLAAETAIVDRIWNQFGNPSFEELRGRSIFDLIDELKAELERERIGENAGCVGGMTILSA